ncbi:TIGR02530 family flagellar biosynthesis protein [Fictibacillus phosphorivorans]|uniref:TIGR02530 family flagellar biosynthesis protein n=1 Tax=Fictibacillus phosphorivorans TaxID=1221500 RepID=UPI00203DAF04|nr:TIGR02530 family flagellar biosynthesis protein [Fictibacillus phosphorivorans]MCM3717154.1 flagellar protein [Fictibacillus phosphorivorans]MCM3774841.1 flagellar protein [Fictibacillus phosphorivorans]
MSERITAHQMFQPTLYPARNQRPKVNQHSFESLFDKELNSSLTVSKHAKKRFEDRNIKITDASWNKISEKVKEAERKGVKDSLVILRDVTLVINAPNKTVITALGRNESASQIFTNINGAIVIDE